MKNTIQYIILTFTITVLGFGVVSNLPSTAKFDPTKVVSASTTPIQEEVHSLIKNLDLKDKEKFYKLTKGVADYCRNVSRIRKVHTINAMMVEVAGSYALDNRTELDALISKKLLENGLNKDALLADSWSKIVTIFDEISDGVKYSIEQTKEVK